MTTPFKLRWYQEEGLDAAFNHFATEESDVLIVMPTGSGKTPFLAAFAQRARENYPEVRIAVMAAQAELVKQNADALRAFLPRADVGIYSAGLNEKDDTRLVTVANIQSLGRVPFRSAYDILVIDEVHGVADHEQGVYRKFIDAQRLQNPALRILGLTATPFKLSSGRITDGKNALFTKICYEAPILRLIEEGFLCRPVMPRTDTAIDATGVALRGGEYIAKELAEAVDINAITEKACDEMVRRLANRHHWVVFAVSVSHSQHIAAALTERGITAAVVHGDLPKDERAYRLQAFQDGEIRALVNCSLLKEGWNAPAVDAVVLMRPTQSAGLYVQQVGRGMRVHPSKKDCMVLDMVGCVSKWGPLDALSIPGRNKGEPTGEAVVKVCPACESYQPASIRLCKECGHDFGPPAVTISATASTAPILSTDVEPVWHDVDSVEYFRHEAKPPKTTDTLRVVYKSGFRSIHSEYVCIEHQGFARNKAVQWWNRRSPEPCPSTIEKALELCDDLLEPTAIATRPQSNNPKYSEICDFRFPQDHRATGQLGLPRVCWSCALFDPITKACEQWGAVPPAEVQAVGCEAWSDDVQLPF